MKNILTIAALTLALTACGYSGRDIETIGQIKRVMRNTPLVCPEFYDIDLSLGVIQNGTGSMSTQDIWVNIRNPKDLEIAKQANETGALVKLTYNDERIPFCTEGRDATKIEIVKKD